MTNADDPSRSAAAHINSIAAIVHDYLNQGVMPKSSSGAISADGSVATGYLCPLCTGTGFKGTFGCPNCGGKGRV